MVLKSFSGLKAQVNRFNFVWEIILMRKTFCNPFLLETEHSSDALFDISNKKNIFSFLRMSEIREFKGDGFTSVSLIYTASITTPVWVKNELSLWEKWSNYNQFSNNNHNVRAIFLLGPFIIVWGCADRRLTAKAVRIRHRRYSWRLLLMSHLMKY